MSSGEKSLTALEKQDVTVIQQVEGALKQMGLLMQSMADTIRVTNERVTTLEKELRQMTPVTSSQADAISKAIRDRALELAERMNLHALPDAVREIAGLIRKTVRLASGIRSVRELPRIDYYITLERIGYWDDYKQLKAVREKYTKGGFSP